MGQACDEKGHISLFDAFEEPGEKVEGNLGVVFAADLLRVKVALGQGTERESEL